MTVFISYSSADGAAVSELARDLQDVGKSVWFDKEIHGGEAWWAAILKQIRESTVFVFALSPNSLESDPCTREFEYARALGIPILPVEIGQIDPEERRNHPVYSEQIVDYRNPTAQSAIHLIRAVNDREADHRPLREPLPPEPPIPYEYLARLGPVIRGNAPIGYTEQQSLFTQLRDAIRRERNESVRGSTRKLLLALRDRPDATRAVIADIDALLAEHDVADTQARPGGNVRPPSAGEGVAAAAASEVPGQPEATLQPSAAIGSPSPSPAPAVAVGAGTAPPPTVMPPPPYAGPSYPAAPSGTPPGGLPPAAGSGSPPHESKRGSGRKLAIILGSVAGAVIVIVILAVLVWPKAGPSPSPAPTETQAQGAFDCWDDSTATAAEQCPAFTGTEALRYAFSLADGADGAAPDCADGDPAEQDMDTAIAVLDCSWSDLPGTLVQLVEWDDTPAGVQAAWVDRVDWDEEFTLAIDDEDVGKTWELASTLDDGSELWWWAAVYDDIPMSFDIFATAEQGGSAATIQAAWDRMGVMTEDEIAEIVAIAP